MFRFYWMSVVFAATTLFAGASLAATAQGVVHELSGTVQVSVAKGKPTAAVKGQQLGNNTTITTGPKSSVIMRFADGTVVALEQNTSFQIQDYNYDEKQPSAMKAFFGLTSGAMRALTGLIGQRNRDSVRVATPNATIGIRGTDFMVAFAANTTTTGVVQGTIAVNAAAGTVTVTVGGASITVGATATQLAALTSIPAGTFGSLTTLQLSAIQGVLTSAAQAAQAAAVGTVAPGVGIAAAAAAAAVAATIAGDENAAVTGTTTGTTGTR
jgi:hypothetical protein